MSATPGGCLTAGLVKEVAVIQAGRGAGEMEVSAGADAGAGAGAGAGDDSLVSRVARGLSHVLHERGANVVESIEQRRIDVTHVAKCVSDIETSACLPR
jgi:hypothetical protein